MNARKQLRTGSPEPSLKALSAPDINAFQEERNSEPVRQFYQIMGKTIRDQGFSPTVWDDRGWFGLVEKIGAT
jgi:hypothetical protein